MTILGCLAKALFTLVALVCIGASALFAFEFGWHKGTAPSLQIAFASIGAGLDLTKAAMPMWATASRRGGEWGKACICWAAFVFLTALSLWCAWGVTSMQLAERVGIRVAIKTEQETKQATLVRLKSERAAIGVFTIATGESLKSAEAAVTAAEKAVAAAEAAVKQECDKVGPNCRKRIAEAGDRRQELARSIAAKASVIRDKAISDRAALLEKQVAEAERLLAAVDVKTGALEADPQAASMAKATGIPEERIAIFSHLFFALALELGSGLLLWLMYGHGPGGSVATVALPRATVASMTVRATGDMTVMPTEKNTTVQYVDQTLVDSLHGSRARFFARCVLPASGERVSASTMYRAYQKWCASEGVEPITANLFGRNPPVTKRKSGGQVWYRDCTLAPAYHVGRPVLKLVSVGAEARSP